MTIAERILSFVLGVMLIVVAVRTLYRIFSDTSKGGRNQ